MIKRFLNWLCPFAKELPEDEVSKKIKHRQVCENCFYWGEMLCSRGHDVALAMKHDPPQAGEYIWIPADKHCNDFWRI